MQYTFPAGTSTAQALLDALVKQGLATQSRGKTVPVPVPQHLLERWYWKPRAAVALETTHVCRHCGSVTLTFEGFGTLMRRDADDAERILMAEGIDQGLPKQRRSIERHVSACSECLGERGF